MRSRSGWALFAACLAFPAILLIIPSTRWAMVDGFRRDFASARPESRWTEPATLAPYQDKPEAVDLDSELAGLCVDPSSDWPRADFEEHPNDAIFLAALIRNTTAGTRFVFPGAAATASRKAGLSLREENRLRFALTWEHLIHACERGIALEPGNAFYPLVAAASAGARERRGDSSRFLGMVGRATYFNDHARETTQIMRRVMVGQFGYRGYIGMQQLEADPTAWRGALRFLAVTVAKSPASGDGIDARRSLVHGIELAFLNARSANEMAHLSDDLVLLADPEPNDLGPWSRRVKAMHALRLLSSELEPGHPTPMLARLNHIVATADYDERERVRNYPTMPGWEGQPSGFLDDSILFIAPGSIALVVVMVLLIPVLGLIIRTGEGYPRTASAPALLAALISLGPFLQDRAPGDQRLMAVAGCAFYLLIASIATLKRAEVYAVFAGILLPFLWLPPILATGNLDRIWFTVAPMIAFVAFEGISLWRRRGKAWRLLVLPQLLILAFAGVAWFIADFTGDPFTSEIRLFLLLGTALLVISIWQNVDLAMAARQARRCTYWITAASGLVCGALIVTQVFWDREGLRQTYAAENSAPQAKEWARANPDGLLLDLKRQEEMRNKP